MSITAETMTLPPRHILVRGQHIRFRLVQQLTWAAVTALTGAYMVSALYYVLTQVHWAIGSHTILYLKPSWDHLLNYRWWPDGRHDIRDVYEGVFATLFAKSILTKRKYWASRVSTWRVATSPLLIFVAAFPVVALGIWAIDVVRYRHGLPPAVHAYQAYIIGFIAAQIVHRLYAPVGNTVQLFFLEEALAGHHRPPFPFPPEIRERYAWMAQEAVAVKDHGTWFSVLVVGMVTVMLALAGYGAYIRLIVAHR